MVPSYRPVLVPWSLWGAVCLVYFGVAVFGFGIFGSRWVSVLAARWFRLSSRVRDVVRDVRSVVSLRFACVASAVLVLFALRALPCVALRCLTLVSCVPVGPS